MKTIELYKIIDDTLKNKSKIVIAIDGQAASGKTTFAYEIKKRYGGSVIHMDDYFLRPEQRTPQRLTEIDGYIDYERFEEEIINHLKDDDIFTTAYDCQREAYNEPKLIQNKKVLIIEGAYALRKSWQKHYDLKILVTIDSELQKTRIKTRNNSTIFQRFINEWIPRENKYIKDSNLDQNVDYIVHIDALI